MGRMFAHKPDSFNCIPKWDGSWGYTLATKNTLCKISGLTLMVLGNNVLSFCTKQQLACYLKLKTFFSLTVNRRIQGLQMLSASVSLLHVGWKY